MEEKRPRMNIMEAKWRLDRDLYEGITFLEAGQSLSGAKNMADCQCPSFIHSKNIH